MSGVGERRARTSMHTCQEQKSERGNLKRWRRGGEGNVVAICMEVSDEDMNW